VPELENENKKLKEKIRELKEELNGEWEVNGWNWN
jgi:hypothetical protein